MRSFGLDKMFEGTGEIVSTFRFVQHGIPMDEIVPVVCVYVWEWAVH